MRLLPLVKGTLQKFKGGKKNEENEEEIADGFHKTPPGEFPRNGPRSSIVAIVMFYVSKIVTIIGLIMVARAVWFEEVGYLHFYWLHCQHTERLKHMENKKTYINISKNKIVKHESLKSSTNIRSINFFCMDIKCSVFK